METANRPPEGGRYEGHGKKQRQSGDWISWDTKVGDREKCERQERSFVPQEQSGRGGNGRLKTSASG
jgi:hypothetical protein